MSSVPRMDPVTRRSALAASASLVLASCVGSSEEAISPPGEPEAIDWNPRPVWVPVKHLAIPGVDLDQLNASLHAKYEGAAWAWDHRDDLPSSYDEVESLPRNIREGVLEALPIATAVELVLERIRRSAADAASWITDEQQDALALAPLTITPEWALADTEERDAMHPDGGWWQRVRLTFTTPEWQRIFGQNEEVASLWCHGRFLGFGDCARAVGW